MNKKLIAALLAALMLPAPAVLSAEQAVEISFKVGDSTLTVNGNALTVNAPYVVGEGTTLVPVRVITEAFGAQVDWDGDAQSVSLKYPDVDITIKIGSRSAVVNTHAEELAAAPELNNDTTMVPLRFISETFGAKVDYDDVTRLITVTKAAAAATDGLTLRGTTDKDYIGDSYYGWTIRNPKKLKMESRSFDGRSTIFTDGSSRIAIYVSSDKKPYDLDTEFNNIKDLIMGDTISIADKEEFSDGTSKIHMRSRNKAQINDIVCYISGKTKKTVVSKYDDADGQEEFFAVPESFSLVTVGRDFYDLSNVQGSMREFKDRELKASFRLPADWIQQDIGASNLFSFYDPEDTRQYVHFEVYSKSASMDAKTMAENDRSSWANAVNRALVSVSDVTQATINGMNAYKYTIEYNGSGDYRYVFSDSFIELGDYIYDLSFSGESFTDAANIIMSLKLEELDKDRVGSMLRSSDLGLAHKAETMYGSASVGAKWSLLGTMSNIIINNQTGGMITINRMTDQSKAKVGEYFPEMMRQITVNESLDSVSATKTKYINSNVFYSSTAKKEFDDMTCYVTFYMMKSGAYLYTFMYRRPDVFYGGSADIEAEKIIFGFEPSNK